MSIDSIIEKRMKDKIKKEILILKSKHEYNKIIEILDKRYDKTNIINCLNELGIRKEIKKDIKNETFNVENKVESNNKINDLLEKKIEKKKEEKININKDINKNEIKKEKIENNNEKDNIKKDLLKHEVKKDFLKYEYEEKLFTLNSRLTIIIIMIVLFVISLSYTTFINYEKGNGTCPYISIDDYRKASGIFLEDRNSFSYIEIDEIIGSYFGKNDCMIINKQTIKKIRNY
jgi:hypothetical protein